MRTDASDREFTDWNEAMVQRHDIERYYRDSHPIVRWIERRRLAQVQSLAGARPGDRLLEVGCGAGHVLALFDGVERTGIDLSATMLERTRRRLGPSIRLIRGAAETLPAADASFDIVVCTEVLEHTRHPAAALRELMRVVTPGGRVIVSIPNERNIDRAKRWIGSVPGLRRLLRSLAAEGNEWHLHDFDLPSLRRLVQGVARIASVRAVPHPLLPVRYVALLTPGSVPHAD